MGCISSVPSEGYVQRNMDNKSKRRSNYNYNYNPYPIIDGEAESDQEGIVDTDVHKMSIFIKKYKLDPLSSVIYNERITVDFLLSQNKENIIAIAKQLSDNIIQQKKFIYAVNTEISISIHPVLEEKSIDQPSILMNKHEFKQRHFRVFIKSTNIHNDNESLPLFVSYTDSISNVLKAYKEKYKSILPNIGIQTLMYCGQQMMNNKDLNYYGVVPESELCLIRKKQIMTKLKKCKKAKKVKKKRNKDRINIFIKTQRYKICIMSMMVLQKMKIKRLKQKIEKKWGISSSNQRLNFKNQELNDENNIFQYDISQNDTIYLTKKMGLFSVFINITSHKNDKKSITIGVEKHDTIKSIKLQIQLYLDIPMVQQRLVYLDKELLDLNATIKSSNICDGGILYIN